MDDVTPQTPTRSTITNTVLAAAACILLGACAQEGGC